MDAFLQAGLEALGDATRMAIFQSLAKGPLAVNQIAEAFPVSRPAVSQHLRVLKNAGLVVGKKTGTRRIYEMNPAGIEVLRAHLDTMWDQALSAFKSSAEQIRRNRMIQQAVEEGLAVRKQVTVNASIEHTFRVFTQQPETWWPATHHIGKTPFKTIVVEPHAGGRWMEKDASGEECDWGTVLAWDPPNSVTFSWHLGPDWQYDPDPNKASQVEIRFVAEGPGKTRVELTHSRLERHGEGARTVAEGVDSPGGWTMILDLFAKVAENGDNR